MSISMIIDRLYVSAMPTREDVPKLIELDIRLILNMSHHAPVEILSQPPWRLMNLSTFDLVFIPIPMNKLWMGVMEALPALQKNESVLVYCHKGRHRSVAMAACILVAVGSSADDAMRLIAMNRREADPYAWHIQRRIRKFEEQWNERLP